MLTVHGLNHFYGGSHTLRGIDLEIPAGSCTAVLGRNGVGKTTFLRCLMGELPVRSGTVLLDGEDITPLAAWQRARRGIAYVPQGRDIFARLTVTENLLVGESAAAGEVVPREELEHLFPLLRTMGKRRGGDLSGGQQQQLAIARALVSRPRVLLLDEPTEGIQPSTIKEIGRVLRMLLERRLTLVLVEQYLDFAMELAQQCVVLSRGEIVMRDRTAVERRGCRASPRAGCRASVRARRRCCATRTRRARCGCSRRATTARRPGSTPAPWAADSWTAIACGCGSRSARPRGRSSPRKAPLASTARRRGVRARRWPTSRRAERWCSLRIRRPASRERASGSGPSSIWPRAHPFWSGTSSLPAAARAASGGRSTGARSALRCASRAGRCSTNRGCSTRRMAPWAAAWAGSRRWPPCCWPVQCSRPPARPCGHRSMQDPCARERVCWNPPAPSARTRWSFASPRLRSRSWLVRSATAWPPFPRCSGTTPGAALERVTHAPHAA